MPTITIQPPLNVSVQLGDTLYATFIKNGQGGKNHPSAGNKDTRPISMGVITGINRSSGTVTFTASGNNVPSGVAFLFASKDNRANMSGILGYFAEVEFKNHSSRSSEIFVAAVDYVPSSK